jgi:hypothetical protein
MVIRFPDGGIANWGEKVRMDESPGTPPDQFAAVSKLLPAAPDQSSGTTCADEFPQASAQTARPAATHFNRIMPGKWNGGFFTARRIPYGPGSGR